MNKQATLSKTTEKTSQFLLISRIFSFTCNIQQYFKTELEVLFIYSMDLLQQLSSLSFDISSHPLSAQIISLMEENISFVSQGKRELLLDKLSIIITQK